MFKISKVKPKEPKTSLRTFRLPIEQVEYLENASKETGVNVTQIVIQMIDYCINNK